MPFLTDRAEIQGCARITRDGYLVAEALVARANNIQEYSAGELGLAGRAPDDVIRVFRPEGVVFDKDALATLAHRPVTLDHPAEPVTADNWKLYAVGDVGDEILRDGDRVRVPLKIMDAAAVASVAKDRQEFSLGYAATLDLTPGTYRGQAYDAALASVAYNHLAACKAARGGAELRIVDERETDRRKPRGREPLGSPPDQNRDGSVKTLTLDGNTIDLADADAVRGALGKLQRRLGDAEAAKEAAEARAATLEARAATLEKQVADAKLTPKQLRDAARQYQALVDKAAALGVGIADDMDEAAVMKAAVASRLGDAAKGWSDTQIAASFATLVRDLPPRAGDPVRSIIADGIAPIADGRAVRDAARASRYQRAA